MNNLYQHFVITRFNVRLNKNDENTIPNMQWQEKRFSLFEKYCFPSIENQTVKAFKWFIFFDKNTPMCFEQNIYKYSSLANIEIVYTDEFNLENIKNAIKSTIDHNIPYLITTRIDNDDTFSFNFIESIQETFKKQKMSFINFPYGYVYSKGKLYNHYDKSSPFISLIEENIESIKTVWCVNHRDAADIAEIIQVDKNIWIQIVHDSNISNRIKSFRINLKRLDNQFAIKSKNESNTGILIENIFLFPIRIVMEGFGSILKCLLRITGQENLKNNLLSVIKRFV